MMTGFRNVGAVVLCSHILGSAWHSVQSKPAPPVIG
jgi:hypothetical protein